MAISYGNIIGRFTVKINGNAAGGAYGFSEILERKPPANKAAIVQLGYDLGRQRATLLPVDHQVVEVVYSEIGNAFKTLPCLDDPIVGTYPPSATVTLLGSGNTTLMAANGTATSGVAAFTFQSASELLVGFADAVAQFRLLGDGYTSRPLKLHALPDLFCNDREARAIAAVSAWYGTTPYVSNTITASVANWWSSCEPYLTMLQQEFTIVRKPGTRGVPVGTGGDASAAYAFCDIERITYKRIGRKQVGRPFGLSVGAVLHR